MPARKKKRRPNGDGALFRRSHDGRYIGRVVVGRDDEGRPIRKQVSDLDKGKAQQKLDALKATISNVDLSL